MVRFTSPILILRVATPNKNELADVLVAVAQWIKRMSNEMVSVRLEVAVSEGKDYDARSEDAG